MAAIKQQKTAIPAATEEQQLSVPQFISTNRLAEILGESTKAGFDAEETVNTLVANGNEIEGFNASFDPLAAVQNVPESAKELGKGLVHILTNPLQTAKGVGSVALGLLEKAVPGAQDHEQAFDVVADAMIERYGSKDKLLNTVEKDPVGFAADLASLLTGAGGAVRGAASTGARAGLLSTRAALRLGETAKTLTRVGNVIDPLTTAGKVVKAPFKAIEKANDAVGVGRLIKSFDVDAKMKEALQMTPSQKINLTRSTFTAKIGERLAKWGVTGTLEEMSQQLGEIATKSRQALDNKLGSIADTFQTATAEKMLEQLYDLRKPEVFTADRFKEIRKRLVQLQVKLENNGLTLSEMNEVKRFADTIAGDKIFKQTGDLKTTAIGQNLGELRKEMRGFIEKEAGKKGVKDVFELNNQTAFAKSVKDVIDKKVLAGAPRKSLSLELAKASTLIMGQVKGALYQVIRSPRFQSDLATAIQLLKDGDFQKLAGGVKFNRQTGKIAGKLQRAQDFVNWNKDAQKVLDKVLLRMQKAYPALRGVRLSGETAQVLEEEE